MISSILLLAAGIFLGVLGAWIIARFGRKMRLLDKPNERSSHSDPIPKGGGVGILIFFIAGAIYLGIPWTLWIPAGILSSVSLLGDYREISFKIRLVVQIGSAAIFSGSVFWGPSMSESSTVLIILLFAFGILFVTATLNYYNFMDGINGIAGITGVIAFTSLGIYGLIYNKENIWAHIALGVAAACLGFLPLNFPRAKVFMGDVGSVLLGFLFASWVLWFSLSIKEFLLLSSFIFPFYLDEISTLIFRLKDKEKLTKAHRRHLYQILANQARLSHKEVTFVYGAIQLITISLVWLIKEMDLIYLISLLTGLSAIYFIIGFRLRHRWEGSKKAA